MADPIQKRIRDTFPELRTTSKPLGELIPVMLQAADRIDDLEIALQLLTGSQAEMRDTIEVLQSKLLKLRTLFRVTVLRYDSKRSHEEIDAELDKVFK